MISSILLSLSPAIDSSWETYSLHLVRYALRWFEPSLSSVRIISSMYSVSDIDEGVRAIAWRISKQEHASAIFDVNTACISCAWSHDVRSSWSLVTLPLCSCDSMIFSFCRTSSFSKHSSICFWSSSKVFSSFSLLASTFLVKLMLTLFLFTRWLKKSLNDFSPIFQ